MPVSFATKSLGFAIAATLICGPLLAMNGSDVELASVSQLIGGKPPRDYWTRRHLEKAKLYADGKIVAVLSQNHELTEIAAGKLDDGKLTEAKSKLDSLARARSLQTRSHQVGCADGEEMVYWARLGLKDVKIFRTSCGVEIEAIVDANASSMKALLDECFKIAGSYIRQMSDENIRRNSVPSSATER